MKRILILTICATFLIKAHGQYVQLIPSMRPAEAGATTQVPNYGKLLTVLQEEILKWVDIKCQEALNQQFSDSLDKARGKVTTRTAYLVVANITQKMDCKIETFRALRENEDPAIIHDDRSKYLVYTVEVYPWIEFKGKRY